MRACVAAAAAGGRITPVKPSITWTSAGVFTLTPVAGLVYSAGGMGTLIGTQFTVTGATGSGTLVSSNPKMGVSATTTATRQSRSTDAIWHDYSVFSGSNLYHDGTKWNWDCPGGTAGGGQWGVNVCHGPGYYDYVDHSYAGDGFGDYGSEWAKIT